MSLVGSGGGKRDRDHKGQMAVGALFGWWLYHGGSKSAAGQCPRHGAVGDGCG